MLKIGEFSRMGQVSVKALRIYDEMGLLKPALVDDWSGYRMYEVSQLPHLWKIMALKDLGLTLEEVREILKENPTPEQIRGMLCIKRVQQEKKIQEEQAKLERVEHLLKIISKEGNMPEYNVVTKKVEDMTVLSIREKIPSYQAIGMQFNAFCDYFKSNRAQIAGPSFAIYHDCEYKESDIDTEIAFPVMGNAQETERIKLRKLQGGLMASTIHTGSYENISAAYKAVAEWIEANGYDFAGPSREVYLQPPDDPKKEPVTEILVPIAKK
jgi:effector-binding domain-containing protein